MQHIISLAQNTPINDLGKIQDLKDSGKIDELDDFFDNLLATWKKQCTKDKGKRKLEQVKQPTSKKPKNS